MADHPRAYLGIRHSDALRVNVAGFIDNIRAGVPGDQVPLLATVMETFLDEAVDALILGISDAIELQGFGRKMVDMMVTTTKTTCHMLSRKVLRKMKNADVRELAEHMDMLRLQQTCADGSHVTYTGIPLDDDLIHDIDTVIALISHESPAQHLPAVTGVILRIMDLLVEHLYSRTLATLRLGPIADRLVRMAYHTVHRGAHTLVTRVLPHMSDQQIRDATGFFHRQIVQAGALDPRPETP